MMEFSNTSFLVLAAIPLVFQMVALIIDEFFYHRRRGLPRWERIGHPVDTFSVLAVTAFAALSQLSATSFILFILGSFFSCFLVTKDEFIHSKLCNAGEQWLHSVLFICHPLVFVSVGFIWTLRDSPSALSLDDSWRSHLDSFLNGMCFLLVSFLIYQIVYWNFIRTSDSDSDLKT